MKGRRYGQACHSCCCRCRSHAHHQKTATAPEHVQQGRVPDNSDFTFELRSVYYDEQWTTSDRERGPVARFRFHNRRRSVLQVHGSYLTIHHDHQITESKTALRSTCNLFKVKGALSPQILRDGAVGPTRSTFCPA